MAAVAGRILRSERGLWFIAEDMIDQIVPRTVVSPIPGSALLMTLVDGDVLPVLPLGGRDAPLVVCRRAGERLALGGLQEVAAGQFEHADASAHVRFENQWVRCLDLADPFDLLASCHLGATPPTGRPE